MDVLATAYFADLVTLYENDGNRSFTKNIIESDYSVALGIYSDDLDGDGEMDVLATSSPQENFTWWANECNSGLIIFGV